MPECPECPERYDAVIITGGFIHFGNRYSDGAWGYRCSDSKALEAANQALKVLTEAGCWVEAGLEFGYITRGPQPLGGIFVASPIHLAQRVERILKLRELCGK